MDDKMKVAVVIIVILVLAVPLLGKLMTEEKPPAGKAVAAAGKAAPNTEPAAAIEPPLLTAQNLVKSKWKMAIEGFEVTVTFAPNGVLIAESPLIQQLTQKASVEGTWAVNGADLTVSASAMGKSITETTKISGNNILARGKPITRLQ